MIKTKEMKTLKIEVPEGYEIDKEKSTFEEIVLKKMPVFPKSWEELKYVEGYFIDDDSNIIELGYGFGSVLKNRNVTPTKKEAEAILALIQLMQLRDRYNGEPLDDWCDWDDHDQTKYSISNIGGEVFINAFSLSNDVLSFKTENLRDEFYKNFKDLLETAKPLL